MLKPQFVCEYCNNTKFTELSLEEHEKACILVNTMNWNGHNTSSTGLRHKKKRHINLNPENQFIEKLVKDGNPLTESILLFCQHLSQELKSTKEEVQKLKKTQYTQKRRYIKDYLATLKPAVNFIDWVKSFQVNEGVIAEILDSNVMYGIKQLWNTALRSYTSLTEASPPGAERPISSHPSNKDSSVMPIIAFKQVPGLFYIYDNKVWRSTTTEDIREICDILCCSIKRYYYSNIEKFKNTDLDIDIQNSDIINLYGISMERFVCHFKKWLYDKIAISVKGIEE